MCLFDCLSRNLLYNRTLRFWFEICKDKKMLEHLGNEPSNFTKERNEKFKFEQKPLEIDDFNNVKEQELNEKRQKKTWNSWKKKQNKSLKQKKKLDEERNEERELWGKLNELNKEFETINNIKKKQKNV